MEWCALIRFMHMDNLYRQHIGKEVYIVTVGEFVTARVCLHVCDCVCVCARALAHQSTIYVSMESMQPSWALMASLGIRACRPCTQLQHGCLPCE